MNQLNLYRAAGFAIQNLSLLTTLSLNGKEMFNLFGLLLKAEASGKELLAT